MARYKVGDTVRVRDDLTCNIYGDDNEYHDIYIAREMEEYRGKYLTIVYAGQSPTLYEPSYTVYYNNHVDRWTWTDYMFDDSVEDLDTGIENIDMDILKGMIT